MINVLITVPFSTLRPGRRAAITALDNLDLIRRSRAAGERMDRVRIDVTGPRSMGFDVTEYQEQADLAREGLALLADAPVERLPVLEKEWKSHREALRAAGELPDPSNL